MTGRAASGPAADPERGSQRHRRCCLHQHAWADRRSDCNNHRADRLKRSDGTLHLSVSAIAAGVLGMLGTTLRRPLGPRL
jgi:hypothetical protein